MIYEYLNGDEPIRQGDIFWNLPVPALDLDALNVVEEDGIKDKVWEEVAENTSALVVPVEKHWAIVASQDCDTQRAPSLTLFKIATYNSVIGTPPSTVRKWVDQIRKRSVENAKQFYLPPDEKIGFTEKMLILFQDVIQIKRESLETRVGTHRKGRLKEVADEHYREAIAQFFRRYPYNEWYPFNKEEFEQYRNDVADDARPYPWQQ